jgi:hypothetical protein
MLASCERWYDCYLFGSTLQYQVLDVIPGRSSAECGTNLLDILFLQNNRPVALFFKAWSELVHMFCSVLQVFLVWEVIVLWLSQNQKYANVCFDRTHTYTHTRGVVFWEKWNIEILYIFLITHSDIALGFSFKMSQLQVTSVNFLFYFTSSIYVIILLQIIPLHNDCFCELALPQRSDFWELDCSFYCDEHIRDW